MGIRNWFIRRASSNTQLSSGYSFLFGHRPPGRGGAKQERILARKLMVRSVARCVA